MNLDINKTTVGIVRWGARAYGFPTFALIAVMYFQLISHDIIGELIDNGFMPFICISLWVWGYIVGWKWELAGGVMILVGSSLTRSYGEITCWNHWMTLGNVLLFAGYCLALKWKTIGGYTAFGGAQLLIVAVYYNIVAPSQDYWINNALPALLFILSWILSRDLENDANLFQQDTLLVKKDWHTRTD